MGTRSDGYEGGAERSGQQEAPEDPLAPEALGEPTGRNMGDDESPVERVKDDVLATRRPHELSVFLERSKNSIHQPLIY